MKCMKCGRETPQDQSFCDSCSAGMKQYPIPVETIVQLPNSKKRQPSKKSNPRRRPPSDREQVQQLKTRLRRLWIALAVVLALLIAVSCISVRMIKKARQPLPGQNYSTTAQKSGES